MRRGPGPATPPQSCVQSWPPQPSLSEWPHSAENGGDVLRPCLCCTLGEKCPPLYFELWWGQGLLEHRQGGGKSGGRVGGGALIHLKKPWGAVLKQIPVGMEVPASPSMAGPVGHPTGWPPENGARDDHKGVLVAQSLGTRVGDIPWRSGHPTWSLSEDVAATRHL